MGDPSAIVIYYHKLLLSILFKRANRVNSRKGGQCVIKDKIY